MSRNPNSGFPHRAAFSLLEALVATAVLILLVTVLFSTLDNSSRALRRANAQMEAFQEARTAFDTLVRSLRSATLNTYWEYDNPTQPKRYIRQSELHFVARPGSAAGPGQDGIFFQSARSYNTDQGGGRALTGVLNTCGFYVEFGPDSPPAGIPVRHRHRLRQLLLPGEQMTAYRSGAANDFRWFSDYWNESATLADNVILLLAWPKLKSPLDPNDPDSDSLTSDYSYNSRTGARDDPQPPTANQMPPLIELTMVVIDEASAARMEAGNAAPAQITAALAGLFETSTRADYEKDMAELERRLQASVPPIAYRIFHTTLPIEESQWSL